MDSFQHEVDEVFSGAPPKRRRGPTRCINIFNVEPNQRPKVLFNKAGQAYGMHAQKLSSFCGVLARDPHLLRLDVPSWKTIDKDAKERVWQSILDKFIIDSKHRRHVMKKINKLWKDYKHRLKARIYDVFNDDRTRVQNCPDDIPLEQWITLIDFWNSELGQRRSTINRENRSHQTMLHTSGSKSFSRVLHEEEEQNPTKGPLSRAELFIMTHTNGDNVPVDDVAAKKIDEMKELMKDLPPDSEDIIGPNDIFAKVMGPEKPGRVRGYGLGPTPTSLFRSSSSQGASSSTDTVELITLKDKVKTLENQLIEMEKQREADKVEAARQRETDREAHEELKRFFMGMERLFENSLLVPPDSSTQPPDDD